MAGGGKCGQRNLCREQNLCFLKPEDAAFFLQFTEYKQIDPSVPDQSNLLSGLEKMKKLCVETRYVLSAYDVMAWLQNQQVQMKITFFLFHLTAGSR